MALSRSIRLFLALLGGIGLSLAACSSSGKSFLKKAMEGDNSEMRLGQMAEQRGSSAELRAFGHMLLIDHAKAKVDALPVVRAHGLAPSDEMASEAKNEATKLAGLSGAAFDREFASYMVKDHEQDIEDFTKAAEGSDQDTARLARTTLPVLRKHLATARYLLDSQKLATG